MATAKAPNPFDKILSPEEEVALQTKLNESTAARQLKQRQEDREAIQPLFDFVNGDVYKRFIDEVEKLPRELEADTDVGDLARNLRTYVHAIKTVKDSKPRLAPDVEQIVAVAPVGTDPLQPVA